jgi:predicted lipoprotein with Yx(FWY)xxD motif
MTSARARAISWGIALVLASAMPATAVPQSAPALPAAVSIMQSGDAPILVSTATGMTLYVNAKDPPGVATCLNKPQGKRGPICSEQWPPLEAVPGDTTIGEYTVVKRDDGLLQWAYRGKPLYLSSKDQVPLDTHGEGVEGTWHIARP